MKNNKTQKNIPDGWQTNILGKIASITAGGTPSTKRNDYWDGEILWMNSGDLNKKIIYEVNGRITQLGLDLSSAKLIPINSVLIGLAGQGKTRGIVAVNKIELSTNQSVAAIMPNDVINYNFLYFNLDRRYKELRQISAGDGGRGGLNLKLLNSLKIKFPPLPEQNRIVSVLETWDKAIEKLTKKIELKKNIKKGLMQRLLTGELRLPGFSEAWQAVNLSDVCKRIRTGKLDANAMVKGGKYRFYTCAKNYYRINDYAFDTEALLVSGNGANVGYIHYYNGKFNAYQRTYVLDNFTSDITFTKYILDEHLHKRIFEEKCDGNTPYIKMDTLTDMKIKMPKTKEERAAIASVVVTADKEVAALGQNLDILKEQKKYLLNNLITGAIRTPETMKISI
ncbi:MAG: restriction endonuclease subunit S [bacterium]|nr:restriction endonuclease subunit S [bacterium]